MNVIYETDTIIATNVDVLNGTRLNSIPYAGALTLQFLADLNNATNRYTLTIQQPGGDVPVDSQFVVGANPSLGGVLDDRQCMSFTFSAPQGGHFTVSLTETGAAICTWRAVLKY